MKRYLRKVWRQGLVFAGGIYDGLCVPGWRAKLSTTPYNVKRAHEEFLFINPDFIPPGRRVDITDHEEGRMQTQALHILAITGALGEMTNCLRTRILMATQKTAARAKTKESQAAVKENDIDVAMGNRNGTTEMRAESKV